MNRALSRWIFVVVLLGIALRFAFVDRPFDHRAISAWHQADYVQIARNFYREDMNILYPRIDWRGDTPGYVEMEFPVLPWIGAAVYHLVGYHEQILRWLSAIASTGTLLLFVLLSGRLPPASRLFAVSCFAVNPLLIYLASAMQPESLALLLAVGSVACCWKWRDNQEFRWLVVASILASLAVLAKGSFAFLGFLLLYTVIRQQGRSAFTDIKNYLAGALAVVPVVAWYVWAAHFWHEYGLSLGVSNESHYLGLDVLFPPKFVLGILKWETLGVFTPLGWCFAVAAISHSKEKLEPILSWLGAVFLFYLITARTSGDDWAFYYHVATVPSACLLMGLGFQAIRYRHKHVATLIAVGVVAGLMGATAFLIHKRDDQEQLLRLRQCATQFAEVVPPDERIVVGGGGSRDEYGKPVAFNDPMFFAWMDRKGFSYWNGSQSLEMLDALRLRGGRYWIAKSSELHRKGFGPMAKQTFVMVDKCEHGYHLFDLTQHRLRE